jgi:hypothetical protein
MAYGGKKQTKMTEGQRRAFRGRSRRLPLPRTNPFAAIPSSVLAQLAREQIPDKESYSRRLNELLIAIQQNGG